MAHYIMRWQLGILASLGALYVIEYREPIEFEGERRRQMLSARFFRAHQIIWC